MPEPDVRKRILAEATHLFAHKGYGSTSVREVVACAGVTKPTLYYYFENKEALYVEAVKAQIALMSDLVRRAMSTSGTVRDRFRAFVEQYVRVALSNRDGVRLAMTATSPSTDERPEIDLMTIHRETLGPLECLLAEGLQAGEIRANLAPRFAVIALVGSATMHLKSALNGWELPPDFADQIVDLYFEGVGVSS